MDSSEHELGHERLLAYRKGVKFIRFAGDLLSSNESRAAVVDHLNRSSQSCVFNVAIGNSRRHTKDRLRCFDVAYGSALESSACLDIISIETNAPAKQIQMGKELLVECVGLLLALRKSQTNRVEENRGLYNLDSAKQSGGKVFFAHERLDVYRVSLEFVEWVQRNVFTKPIKARFVTGLDRLSTSLALNIAERNGRFSVLDHSRFLDIAQDSAVKASAYLDVLAARGMMTLT